MTDCAAVATLLKEAEAELKEMARDPYRQAMPTDTHILVYMPIELYRKYRYE